MPTPKITPTHPKWPDAERAARMRDDEGLRTGDIANASNVDWHAVKRLLKAWDDWQELSDGTKDAMASTGTESHARHGWRRVEREDGTGFDSVFWKIPPEEEADRLEAIREAFEGIKPAKPVRPPRDAVSDLCSIYPATDIHMNMRAFAAATGGTEYNIELACEDLLRSFQKVMLRTSDSEDAVLLLNGDTLDTDNERGTTPRHGHILQKDAGQFPAIMAMVGVLRTILDMLLAKHKRVRVRVLRGNHDETCHTALTAALMGYFHLEDRVTVESVEMDLWQHRWGDCATFAHHGDIPRDWAQFALMLSDVCEFWSATHHRTCFFGHGHRAKEGDFGAINIEMLRPFTPLSKHAAGLGYVERRALHSVTLDKRDGIVNRGLDPVLRKTA